MGSVICGQITQLTSNSGNDKVLTYTFCWEATMKVRLTLCSALSALILLTLHQVGAEGAKKDYPITPIPFTRVKLTDHFWKKRLDTNQDITIPYAFQKCEETGRIQNFEVAGGLKKGTFKGRYPFDDSDVYKIIEGASYSQQVKKNPALEQYLDELIKKIAAAQESDGYLYTARTIKAPSAVLWCDGPRWSNLYLGHELYNMGHFYEAAAAHYLATGKKTMLNMATKNADLLVSVFGPGKNLGVPGHQVIEIGLAKLFRITGNPEYLRLAKFFLDQRGNGKHRKLFGQYSQDHLPVLQQKEAVGHAVRAAYMYAGMADIAALSGDQSYLKAITRLWENVVTRKLYLTGITRLWENVVTRKLYLTGGIGSTGRHEGFGPDYDLPNASAYAETCAAIANVFWNHRMFLMLGDGKYMDVLERTLYNGALSGISLSGNRFFYPNPLKSYGQHQRSPWFGCACCPSNITRFMPSIPSYIYAVKGNALYISLFVQGEGTINMAGQKVVIKQKTRYPDDGKILIHVEPEKAAKLDLLIRIPGWARNQPVPGDLYRYKHTLKQHPILEINSGRQKIDIRRGYTRLSRIWQKGDEILLTLPMPLRQVLAHPKVKDNVNKVAFEKGPLVYCAEWKDNDKNVFNLLVPDKLSFASVNLTGKLSPIKGLTADVFALHRTGASRGIQRENHKLVLIPYYAWAHRGQGEMAVWLAAEPGAALIKPGVTLAAEGRISASKGIRGIGAINDRYEPRNSNDRSIPRCHWWPKKGSAEWIQFDFKKPVHCSSVKIYWFDDTGTGECRIPESWQVFYKKGDEWIPVNPRGGYPVSKDRFNAVTFTRISCRALRIKINLQQTFSAGIYECKIE
jgi:DUF1680 family protein